MTAAHFDQSSLMRTNTIRPLGFLSDFIVEALPELLSDPLAAVLDEKLEELNEAFTPEQFLEFQNLSLEQARIACLDLALLFHVLQHRQKNYPLRLYLLFLHFAKRLERIPTLLYEDSILFNPILEDPRLFSHGADAAAERDFLHIHVEIEASLEKVIVLLLPLLEAENRHLLTESHLQDLQREIEPALKQITSSFVAMRHMPLERFKAFRDLYAAPAASKFNGVSGRFSETMNSLRILVEGKEILEVIPNYFSELLENLAYYPSIRRERLKNLITRAVFPEMHPGFSCLDEIAKKNPASHMEHILAKIRHFSDAMVHVHFHLTQKYVIHDLEKPSTYGK